MELTNSTEFYDIVVDFSSRKAEELQQVVDLLPKRIGLYILMSSHLVYEVRWIRRQCTESRVALCRHNTCVRVEHLNRSNEHTTFSADSCSDIIIRELGISRIVVPGPEVSIESPAPLAEDAARRLGREVAHRERYEFGVESLRFGGANDCEYAD